MTSAQLEREAENIRAHISADLEELRTRITPGHLVDQVVDYARGSGAAEFVHNLRAQVVKNPMPVAVVGAGLAWLVLSSFRTGPGGSSRPDSMVSSGAAADRIESASELAGNDAGELTEGARQGAGEWVDDLSGNVTSIGARAQSRWQDARQAVKGAASTTASQMQNAARSASDGAAAASEAAAEQARRARQSISDAASGVRATAANIGGDLSESGGELVGFLKEHPLVLAGVGVVLGALIGAALPVTETENRVMGEPSDTLKEDTAELAREQVQKGAAVAEAAWQGAKEEAQREGLPGFEPSQGDEGVVAAAGTDDVGPVPSGEGTAEKEPSESSS
jgi:hypothetical protein